MRMLANPVADWEAKFISRDRGHPQPEFHLDILDDLMYRKRHVVRAPRSYAKTTKIRNFILFLMYEQKNIAKGLYPGIYPHTAVRYLSYAGEKAEELTEQIDTEVTTNEILLNWYGDIRGKTWTQKKQVTKGGFTFTVAGRGAQVRGFRPTLLICDDLDDDEEVESDERLEKAFRWFDSAVYGTIDEEDYQVFVIGTTLEEVSLLNYIADKPSFSESTYRAYIDGVQAEGHELWPSKWPHEKLQRRLDDIKHRAFMSEYMNEPQPSESPIFERNWFQEYDPDSAMFEGLLEKTMFTVACIDPAISKKDGADFSALVSVSATFEDRPRIFVRTVRRGHWSLPRQVTETFKMYDDLCANEVGVEKVAYQAALCDEINRFMEINQRNMEVKAMVPDGDKERRANSVVPYVERSRVYIDPDDPMHKRLVDECVLFKPGKLNIKKDIMDAFVYCLLRVKKWEKRREKKNDGRPKKVLPQGYHLRTAGAHR